MVAEYWKANPLTRDDPSRETALALVETIKTGDGEFSPHIADRCFMLFGYPELEPVAVARWLAERSMRPLQRQQPTTADTTTTPTTPPDHSYGLGRRS